MSFSLVCCNVKEFAFMEYLSMEHKKEGNALFSFLLSCVEFLGETFAQDIIIT